MYYTLLLKIKTRCLAKQEVELIVRETHIPHTAMVAMLTTMLHLPVAELEDHLALIITVQVPVHHHQEQASTHKMVVNLVEAMGSIRIRVVQEVTSKG